MTTCARCGAAADHLVAITDGTSWLQFPATHDFCVGCIIRVRVALDWALGGDGGFDAAYIERLESVCCAVKFDEGWREQAATNWFNVTSADYRLWNSDMVDPTGAIP